MPACTAGDAARKAVREVMVKTAFDVLMMFWVVFMTIDGVVYFYVRGYVGMGMLEVIGFV